MDGRIFCKMIQRIVATRTQCDVLLVFLVSELKLLLRDATNFGVDLLIPQVPLLL